MATPPTRVSYNVPTTGNYSSSTTPKTTAAFAVTVSDLIVVIASGEGELWVPGTPSASGGTVTWTSRFAFSGAASQSGIVLWTGAVGATAASITVSMPGAGGTFWGMSATVWRSHGGVGSVFSGNNGTASGAPAVSAACAANSAVQVGVNDWNAADGTIPTPGHTWRTINGAPQTESLYFRDSAHHAAYGGYTLDTGAAGTITQGLTTPSTMRWVSAGVEILGTASATASTLVRPRAMSRVPLIRASTF